jgi:hypothetical protein
MVGQCGSKSVLNQQITPSMMRNDYFFEDIYLARHSDKLHGVFGAVSYEPFGQFNVTSNQMLYS